MDYITLLFTIMLAVSMGNLLADALRMRRAKKLRKLKPPKLSEKPEPQTIEFQIVLTGAEEFERGLDNIGAAFMRIGEMTDGVPVTVNINNYYSGDSMGQSGKAHDEWEMPRSVPCGQEAEEGKEWTRAE